MRVKSRCVRLRRDACAHDTLADTPVDARADVPACAHANAHTHHCRADRFAVGCVGTLAPLSAPENH